VFNGKEGGLCKRAERATADNTTRGPPWVLQSGGMVHKKNQRGEGERHWGRMFDTTHEWGRFNGQENRENMDRIGKLETIISILLPRGGRQPRRELRWLRRTQIDAKMAVKEAMASFSGYMKKNGWREHGSKRKTFWEKSNKNKIEVLRREDRWSSNKKKNK